MTRIRPAAVIFDYGNVLSAPQGQAEVETMASMLEVPAHRFQQAYWRFRYSYDEAALDPTEYWNRVAEQLSRRLSQTQIATLLEVDSRSWAYPAPAVPQWAREIRKAFFKTALLSNMPASVRDYITRCAWLPQFDQQTFSCDVRAAKPAAAIFEHCLDGLRLPPREVLFLDDRPENVQAAEALGLHAIVHKTSEQTAKDLALRFAIPVPLAATLDKNQ